MLRLLIRGDVHLGLVSDGLPRLDEQVRVLDHVQEVLDDVDPDVYVDLGDLFNSPRPAPDAYASALLYAQRLGNWAYSGPRGRRCGGGDNRAFVISGNHDKPTRGSVNALTPLQNLGRQLEEWPKVLTWPDYVSLGDFRVRLLFLPYVSDWEARRGGFASAQELIDGSAKEAVETLDPDWQLLAFTHLEVPGSSLGNDEAVQRDVGTRIPDVLGDERVSRVYAGHVHKPQRLDRVTVVGSALHVNFGEAADLKRALLVEV